MHHDASPDFPKSQEFSDPPEKLVSISSYGRFQTMTGNEFQPIFGILRSRIVLIIEK